MFLKRAEPRSIASQLVLLFTLAAALLLSCGLGIFYWLVVRHAFEEDNAALADKVAVLRANLKTGGPQTLDQELKIVRRGEHIVYWIRVLDFNGQTLAETAGMNPLLPGNVFPPASKPGFPTRSPKNYRTDRRLFSLVTVAENDGGQPYAIQVAQDRSSDKQFTKQFGILLAIVAASGLIVSVMIAVTVAHRGLLPLARMRRSVEKIDPTHLNERLALSAWPSELQPLAATFDDMLERLEISFTQLSQFSADLAHELRTPIANILGESQVALTQARTAQEYRQVIESTVAECERLSGIVDNLLFLARAESADKQIKRSLFDGRAAIEKMANYYSTLAEDRGIIMKCIGEGQLFADPALFGRALSNLVENALRFTNDGGTIGIEISPRAQNVEVSVTDTGSGIDAEHLPRVFDRFYRADPSRSSQGAGLGLALVKSIVDLHGGSAKIESETGRGTTVILIFPNQGFERN